MRQGESEEIFSKVSRDLNNWRKKLDDARRLEGKETNENRTEDRGTY